MLLQTDTLNQSIYEQVMPYILGELTVVQWIVGLIFGWIGIAISFLLSYKNRKKDDLSTPNFFSFKFFIYDNLLRFVTNFFTLLVVYRFMTEFVSFEYSPFYCLIIGIGIDSGIISLSKLESKVRNTVLMENEQKIDESTTNKDTE